MNERQCDKEKLAAYLRGDLDDRACDEVEAHATECDACRAEIESSVGRIGKALRDAYPMESPPERIRARVMSASSARKKWRVVAYVLVPATAALAIILLLPDRGAPVATPALASLTVIDGAAIVRDQAATPGQAVEGERVFSPPKASAQGPTRRSPS
ncbi:MAG: zf-HC2 domain-containing protein [Armatimonadetes bacterium]|nr:zf-HC2 domain-containing protein [Armatimonadota bacterium]